MTDAGGVFGARGVTEARSVTGPGSVTAARSNPVTTSVARVDTVQTAGSGAINVVCRPDAEGGVNGICVGVIAGGWVGHSNHSFEFHSFQPMRCLAARCQPISWWGNVLANSRAAGRNRRSTLPPRRLGRVTETAKSRIPPEVAVFSSPYSYSLTPHPTRGWRCYCTLRQAF
ncbi:hypothetical protein [Paenibacillus sp. GP183]|uniref:hypothetical protein n=1 Tax=Paenibacillus sp. GP183 TaxID=1882751 RepID=UPI0011154248|nr:hypothetical protein [Paenibacillus sp. GP183]